MSAQRANSDVPASPRQLADWLLAHGRHWVTSEDVASLLDIPLSHVSPTLSRWRQQGLLFSPTRGAYVPIPPEYRSWRAVPASHFIDTLMRHLGHDYYVSMLSAAEAHGYAHQRPQVFQVMTPARLRDRSFGRVRLSFITSVNTAERPVDVTNTPTGTMRVSTLEVTALDLVSMPRHAGGLSNIATILGEMAQESVLDTRLLADVAALYPTSIAARAGWLLDFVAGEVGARMDLKALQEIAASRKSPTPLDSRGARGAVVDERWNVIINRRVEPDL